MISHTFLHDNNVEKYLAKKCTWIVFKFYKSTTYRLNQQTVKIATIIITKVVGIDIPRATVEKLTSLSVKENTCSLKVNFWLFAYPKQKKNNNFPEET